MPKTFKTKQSGRATLEMAIAMVEADPRWPGARVVYGDTDSLFVALPGLSRDAAADAAEEIAAAVTRACPRPVLLKVEKIYDPCVLLAKKRYAGRAFVGGGTKLVAVSSAAAGASTSSTLPSSSPAPQLVRVPRSPFPARPTFDAKGIETVRRDSCPAAAKMLEGALRILFDSRDLSLVKTFCCRQWARILSGRVCVADLVFCKEVRAGAVLGRSGEEEEDAERGGGVGGGGGTRRGRFLGGVGAGADEAAGGAALEEERVEECFFLGGRRKGEKKGEKSRIDRWHRRRRLSIAPYLVGARGVAGGAVWAPSKPPVPRAGSLERPGVRGEDAEDEEGCPLSLMVFRV